MKIMNILRQLAFFVFIALILTLSVPTLSTPLEKARKFTRSVEFDYVSWTLDALRVKFGQIGINPRQVLTPLQQHAVVIRYIELTKQLEEVQARIQQIYSDPEVNNPAESARNELEKQEDLQGVLTNLTPIAESLLQAQVNEVIVEMEITRIGDVLPPVLFHTSPLPKALIVSPRDKIQQDVNVSLLADLTLEQIAQLETEVEKAMGSSALVVDVGGIGVYPTMVMRSSNLTWITDVIAHEWTHNYLTIHPLGLSYDKTPELRTMNETTASIAGSEISYEILRQFYPELLAVLPAGEKTETLYGAGMSFDFRAEMHKTRVHVDELLSQGKTIEAEHYMEERRAVFVSRGYLIRRLNQAYFAFYGAYADQPGGAAGQDPVGPAVRELRAQSGSLADFLRKISQMNTFVELEAAIAEN
ncbi:MAG: hypothetical protein C0401_03625 [Anaerolinea sp.]|nr:hypothetical protein [Anaerolinea sp.]